ncbi:MAG: hypothetical protein QQN61_07060 [Nitrosopumilus sp.]
MKLIVIFSILLIVGIGEASAELTEPINIEFNAFSGVREYIFNDSQLDFCTFSDDPNINMIAAYAVKEWRDSLVRLTGNDVWDMVIHVSPTTDEICDVTIEYKKIPTTSKQFLIGMAGYVNSVSPTITIFTDNYQKTLTENEPIASLVDFEDIVKNSEHDQLSDEKLSKTIKHEIGHILGAPDNESCLCLMGTDMDSSEILVMDIINIVHSYPNGFVDLNFDLQFNLGDDYTTKTYFVGDYIDIEIKLPMINNKIPDISLYIYPDGKDVKTLAAQVKIHNEFGMKGTYDQNNYFSKIEVINGITYYANTGTFSTMKIMLQPQTEMSQVDILVKVKDKNGIEELHMLENVIIVKEGLFSNLNLDSENFS